MATNLIMTRDITAQYSKFRDFLRDIGLSDSVIEDYTRNISHIDQFLLKKKAGCQSVYQITDRILLKAVIDALPERYPLWTSRFRLPLDRYMQFLQVVDEREIVDERFEAFRKYLVDNLINRSDAEHYSNLLRDSRIIDTMIKSFGVSSVYCIDNENVLDKVALIFRGIDSRSRYCDAISLYKKWLISPRNVLRQKENNQLEVDFSDLQRSVKRRSGTIARLEAQLAEKDAQISSLKEQCEAKTEELEEHDAMCDLLTLDAIMRYCNEDCTEPSEVKTIRNLLCEVYQGVTDERWVNAKKELLKRIKALKNPMNVQNLVLEQNIAHNVENVEAGAVGIKVSGRKKA